tara:strand:+ start:15440 stop:15832 length:393 start_codon:yes stop_codon:yes gene_type:complete
MEELKGIQYNTPLSRAFFSRENIDGLQTNIRYNVWLSSGKKHIIGKQNSSELVVIMRSIFLQNSKNRDSNILYQVKDLNKIVLDYTVDKILTQVKQYISYKNDISNPRQIMDHSVNTSIRGSRQLEQNPW